MERQNIAPPYNEAGLNVGDMILAVNKDTLLGSNYDTAAALLKKTEGVVTLVVCNPNKAKEEEKKTTELTVGQSDTTPSHSTPKSDKSGKASQSGTPKLAPPGSLSPSPSAKLKVEVDENLAATAQITPGVETTIEINKDKLCLGLNIIGGSDTHLGLVVVNELYPEGAAAKDGRLQPGDQILELNNEDFRNIVHSKALSVLSQTPIKVRMLIFREEGCGTGNEMDALDIIELELAKKPGKGLGIGIAGKKSGPGYYISEVLAGGVASSDGRLMKGDQLISVNGQDLRKVSLEEAAAILKTTSGKVAIKLGRFKISEIEEVWRAVMLDSAIGIHYYWLER